MTKKRLIKALFFILSLILIWGIIWTVSITKKVRKNNLDNNMQNQQALVKNIIVTETQEEKKFWEFYAKSGIYNSENTSIQLNDVIGNFYDKDGQVVVSFKTTKGTYDEKTKKVVLNGDNLIVGKDGARLHADELIWQGQDKDILANGNVQYIIENKLVAKAKNAVFNSDLTKFKIINSAIVKIYGTEEDKKKYTL